MKSATTVVIEPLSLEDPTVLYSRPVDAVEPLPVALRLSLETGTLWCDHDVADPTAPGVTATRLAWPMAEQARRVLRWPIPVLTAVTANALLAELEPLAQEILDGAAITWSIRDQAQLGEFTPGAEAAIERITARCADIRDLGYVFEISADPCGWAPAGRTESEAAAAAGVTPHTTDAELVELAEVLRQQVLADERDATQDAVAADYWMVTGALDYLTGLRRSVRAAVATELEQVVDQLAALEERRAELITQMRAPGWRAPYRAIAPHAGLSASRLQELYS